MSDWILLPIVVLLALSAYALVIYAVVALIEDSDDERDRLYPGRFPRTFGARRITRR